MNAAAVEYGRADEDDETLDGQSIGDPVDAASFMSEFQSNLPTPPQTSKTTDPKATSNPSGRRSPLDPSNDARQLVRLLQCQQCSEPLQSPLTLPCGNSLCRRCLPELHVRHHISYPATANRLQGFTCPFPECGQDHAAGDCSLDVTLAKVMEIVKTGVETLKAVPSETPLLLVEKDKWEIAGVASLNEKEAQSNVYQGGRLVATYTMVEKGELPFDSEVSYTTMSPTSDDYRYLDVAVLEHLKETTRSELDCQVCYALFLDPLTTSCGHTFCRKCLRRVLDHSNCCPICRRHLAVAPSLTPSQYPSNKRLSTLLASLCPASVAQRTIAVQQEEENRMGELDTPLFLCTLSFPSMPTFLHIFEPRYRLMMRRAMESGDRKFGMLLHNMRQSPQGDLGRVPFYQYGTLLHIVSMQLLSDGRSLVETIGISRFRVVKHGMLDGYVVGQIERVDDIALSEEEALEASETASVTPTRTLSATDHLGTTPHQPSPRRPSPATIDSMSTQELMEAATSFVHRMQVASAPWLHTRVLQVHGDCPDDPALFPWWFASILPISEGEKYRLLSTRSVRARLKICVSWVRRIEAQRW